MSSYVSVTVRPGASKVGSALVANALAPSKDWPLPSASSMPGAAITNAAVRRLAPTCVARRPAGATRASLAVFSARQTSRRLTAFSTPSGQGGTFDASQATLSGAASSPDCVAPSNPAVTVGMGGALGLGASAFSGIGLGVRTRSGFMRSRAKARSWSSGAVATPAADGARYTP